MDPPPPHARPQSMAASSPRVSPRPPPRIEIETKIKRRSRLELGALEGAGVSVESELLLRFSLKESVYKAIHPFVRRYVSFHEVHTHQKKATNPILYLSPSDQRGVSSSHPTHTTIPPTPQPPTPQTRPR